MRVAVSEHTGLKNTKGEIESNLRKKVIKLRRPRKK